MTSRITLSLALLIAASGLSACGGDDPATTCEAPISA